MPLSQLASIRIQGRVFGAESTELQLFQNPTKNRLGFIFGENGSGKSTIAQCLAQKRPEELPEGIKSFELIDTSGNCLKDKAEVLERTFVFDELFIEKNVHITEGDIEAIIMLGGRRNLETEIEMIKDQEKERKARRETTEKALERNADSLNEQRQKLETALKIDGGWADREKEILGNKIKSKVSGDLLEPQYWETIVISEGNEATLREKIIAAINTLNDLRDFEPTPYIETPQTILNDAQLSALLRLEIKQPTSTGTQGTRIQEILKKDGSEQLERIATHFIDQNTTFCPFCLRDITPELSTQLIKLIHQILDESAKNHIAELKEYQDLLTRIPTPDFEPYRAHFPNEVSECKFALDRLRQASSIYSKLFEAKINNPYQPVIDEYPTYDSIFNDFLASIKALNLAISQRNERANQSKTIREGAQDFNRQLAKFEILPILNSLNTLTTERINLNSEIVQIDSKIKELDAESKRLQAEMSNISIALEAINKNLSFIFADCTRLELRGSNGRYSLYSRGTRVKPFNVSTGERNAIALCYFISLLNENQSTKSSYSNEMLVVFDDPISSFDYSNRLGTISFLRSEIIKILAGNAKSKIICLTHDALLMQNFNDLLRSIQECLAQRAVDNTKSICCYRHLTKATITDWKLKNLSYSDSLLDLFQFGGLTGDFEVEGFGNLARRTLEAFAAFEFNAGPSDVLLTASTNGRITNPKLSEYFERNLLHFILNSESHSSDNVHLQTQINPFPTYSREQVQKCIRDTLCFIYAVDRTHLLSHLDKKGTKIDLREIEKVLDNWIADIETSLA